MTKNCSNEKQAHVIFTKGLPTEKNNVDMPEFIQKPTGFINNLVQSLQSSKLTATANTKDDEPKIDIKINQVELQKA